MFGGRFRTVVSLFGGTIGRFTARLSDNPYLEKELGKFALLPTTQHAKFWRDSFARMESEKYQQPFSRQLVVTASGPDRPGIVSRLSKVVLESGGNVEESRMARLAGDFSILMLVTIETHMPKAAEELTCKLSEIENLQVNTRWTSDDRLKETKPRRKFRRISLRGADNPGLVYNVAEYLATNRINIENLETSTQEAPFGGSTLFTMEGVITMPIAMSTKQLVGHLDCLQTTLGVEITVSNLDPAKQAEDFRDWSENILLHGRSKYASSSASGGSPGIWSIPDVSI